MSSLNETQLERIKVIFDRVYPDTPDRLPGFVAGFAAEPAPEREIRTWEWISIALEAYDQQHTPDRETRAKVQQLMVVRSMFPNSQTCLEANPPDGWEIEDVEGILAGMDALHEASGAPGFAPAGIYESAPTPMLDRVETILEAMGIEGARTPGATRYEFTARVQHGVYRCAALTEEATSVFMFFAILDQSLPLAHATEMAVLVTQLNLHFRCGCLTWDARDGELGMRAGLSVRADLVTADLIKPLVELVLTNLDRIRPHATSFAEGGATMEETVASIVGR